MPAEGSSPATEVRALRVRDGRGRPDVRQAPEEAAVALVHDAATTAVMMATPADLEEFGVGFSFTEGVIGGPGDIRDLEVATSDAGVEVRMWLEAPRATALTARRRRQAGPTGCGLCGVESLAEALRPPPHVGVGQALSPQAVFEALAALPEAQPLGRATRAVHAAGWWTPGTGYAAVREDVGRHNALDKLAGALVLAGGPPPGALVLTSRVSVEMVQKAAVLGAQILVAVSAPTALAIRVAEAAGITLVGIAREDGFEVFTRPERITGLGAGGQRGGRPAARRD